MSLYLAPLNYDRYFKKVFSELRIAKRFLEDFLDITIQSIEYLPTKKTITDDSRYVEFDFRCKIDDNYVIIDMQQWYKPDVVQRFYLYHSLNSALQLEDLPKKVIVLPENKSKIVKDYSDLTPVITIIWMVHDVLGFTDDYVAYSLTPEDLSSFINEIKLWKDPDIKEIVSQRNTIYKKLNNPEKSLPFLQTNRLIYAFQPNIVKNKKYAKYFPWFELADKTLRKITEKFEYTKYSKDEILQEVIRRLKQSVEDPSELEYIKNYDEYLESVKRYDRALLKEGYQKAKYELSDEINEARIKEEKAIERENEARIKEEKAIEKENEARIKEEKATERENEAMKKLALKMLKYGEPIDEIAKETGFSVSEIENMKQG